MTSRDPESVALALVAQGKRILAADEPIPTLTNALYLPWGLRVHQRRHHV
jgi:hypothetical protein